MSLAAISVAALILALLVSCTSSVHVGFLAIVLAWIVGVYFGGMSVDQVIAGFPTSLFLTLVGVTLLFAQAQVNGTLDRIAHRAVRLCRGNAGVIPMMFFVLTAGLASIGPGHIASAALIAPMGMAVAGRYGISAFLMAIMIGNGASAGSLSPFAPTGIIVAGILPKIGLVDVQWPIYLNNLIAHAAVAFGGYFLLGGWRLFARRTHVQAEAIVGVGALPDGEAQSQRFELRHSLTLGVIATLIVAVITLKLNVGMGAFAGAVLLTLAGAADETEAIRKMPWKVIMMVTGVTVLIGLLEKTGGMELFVDFLARMATPASATAVAAFFTGLISIYSSTSGVVLPAFLPTVPGLIERLGSGDTMALVSSMNVGAHLVDISPLSTTGALCLAAAPLGTDNRLLFNKLLAWGLSMTVVGAFICWVFFGLL
ncbi:MAG: SLC13 family permease [Vicinamibacterales bacterium]